MTTKTLSLRFNETTVINKIKAMLSRRKAWLSFYQNDEVLTPKSFVNQRSDVLTVHHAFQVSNLVHVENIDGQIVVVTHHNG